MRRTLAAIFLTLAAQSAQADERAEFYGVWGTAKQCAGEPIKPGGTALAAPFEIGEEWLRQGQLWCQLSWFPIVFHTANLTVLLWRVLVREKKYNQLVQTARFTRWTPASQAPSAHRR